MTQYRGPFPEEGPCSSDGCNRAFCGHGPVENEVHEAVLLVPNGKKMLRFDVAALLDGAILESVHFTKEDAVRSLKERFGLLEKDQESGPQ